MAPKSKPTAAGSARRIEYMPLEAVPPALRNPKKHAEEHLDGSLGRFGYTEPVLMDERTGRLVAGHGRIDTLKRLRQKGQEPPEGVMKEGDAWLVPVVRGWASRSDQEAEAYLLASNQLTIAGGWDADALESMLKQLSDAGVAGGLGWSEEELGKLLDLEPSDELYTSKIQAPIYEPTGEKPKVSELYDAGKMLELAKEIDETEGLSQEERVFLRFAAQRHIVFDYQNVAEFYAHASPGLQRLMEKSALVVIDFQKAIENGFVTVTKDLAENAAQSLALEDEDEEEDAA
jgi:hypothetical protein